MPGILVIHNTFFSIFKYLQNQARDIGLIPKILDGGEEVLELLGHARRINQVVGLGLGLGSTPCVIEDGSDLPLVGLRPRSTMDKVHKSALDACAQKRLRLTV